MMMTEPNRDLDTLSELNNGYVRAYEHGDVEFYRSILTEDFTSSEPDCVLRNKTEFLEMMLQPRPLSDLKAHEVKIRVLGDFAIIHGGLTYRDAGERERRGRYTDDYQRRDGKWVCVSGTVIAD
jgi:hypothetical protein